MGRVVTTEALRFMVDCLKAAGAGPKPAQQHGELLLIADKIGHASHGLNRLGHYIHDILVGDCEPNNEPQILKETESTAWVDANNVLGATASHFCMDLAMTKAWDTGVGWITCKGSNHYGVAGVWTKKAAAEGLIGMTFTNTSPGMAPTRSKKPAVGTNPFSVVAPALDGDSFYLELATTCVAMGKIEMSMKKGLKLPLGWAQGPDGKATTDAKVAYQTKCLMPLGGGEETAGYKGYGLSAMVDLLSGICAGSSYGHHVRSWSLKEASGPANLGHCFAAIDPECFAPGFRERVTECIKHWRQLEPLDPKYPVLAPGDVEKIKRKETEAAGTIFYVKKQLEISAEMAKQLKVKPMDVKPADK